MAKVRGLGARPRIREEAHLRSDPAVSPQPFCRYVAFRAAGAEDVPALVTLINEAYRVEAFFVSGPRTSAPEVEELRRSGVYLIAEEADGRPAGCVYVGRRGEHGYFGLLSVDPVLQGRGIGRRLAAAAEARLWAEGHREVEILVVDLRKELFAFYAGLGYREVGEEPFPAEVTPSLPCHFVVLRKPLG